MVESPQDIRYGVVRRGQERDWRAVQAVAEFQTRRAAIRDERSE